MNAMHTSVFSLFLASHPGMLHPGSGPSTPEVTPLLPALFLIISTVVTMLLELFGLEEEEEDGSP
jgi:hypothetical protein